MTVDRDAVLARALVEETCRKSALVWLRPLADVRAQAAWHSWVDGAVHLVTGGLLVLQVGNVAGGHLHSAGHLGGRCAVNARAWQRRRARVQITADTNDECMAIDARGQAAHTECEH